MKIIKVLAGVLLFLSISCAPNYEQDSENKSVEHAVNQTKIMLEEVQKLRQDADQGESIPRTIAESGELHLVPPDDWTSGFFPGVLWLLYEHTQDEFWREQARKYTGLLEQEQFDTSTHDTGFKIYCSYGTGNRIAEDEQYREVIIQTAKTLITRYNPTVGAIRSWDHSADKWDFPVIIDNMMNLELLFAATRFTGDSTYYDVAVNHANTTMENHFREDKSSYHVIDYNPETGEVQNRNTHQGYDDASAWARGQAWGLYGYTMSFRETGDEAYLELAKDIADLILNHPQLPEDKVPYWDFDVPEIEQEPRDVSAAAIIASSLYELSTFCEEGSQYRLVADEILASLSEKYSSPDGENKGFILQNSTGHKPHKSEIDVPINYADYYYLEALLRQQQLVKTDKIST